jgi:hypothetical protein
MGRPPQAKRWLSDERCELVVALLIVLAGIIALLLMRDS